MKTRKKQVEQIKKSDHISNEYAIIPRRKGRRRKRKKNNEHCLLFGSFHVYRLLFSYNHNSSRYER